MTTQCDLVVMGTDATCADVIHRHDVTECQPASDDVDANSPASSDDEDPFHDAPCVDVNRRHDVTESQPASDDVDANSPPASDDEDPFHDAPGDDVIRRHGVTESQPASGDVDANSPASSDDEEPLRGSSFIRAHGFRRARRCSDVTYENVQFINGVPGLQRAFRARRCSDVTGTTTAGRDVTLQRRHAVRWTNRPWIVKRRVSFIIILPYPQGWWVG
jgi:hypothetical protein